jgi:hypothetical protein
MVIWFGKRLFGKVDQVPGLFHVATQFFHIQFCPLIPLQSVIVLAGTDGERGVPTSMSLKSVLMAWFRAFLCISMVGCVVWGIAECIEASERHRATAPSLVPPIVGFVGAAAFYWMSVRFSRAGFDRARDLATQAGLPEEVVEPLFHGGFAAEPCASDRFELPEG